MVLGVPKRAFGTGGLGIGAVALALVKGPTWGWTSTRDLLTFASLHLGEGRIHAPKELCIRLPGLNLIQRSPGSAQIFRFEL